MLISVLSKGFLSHREMSCIQLGTVTLHEFNLFSLWLYTFRNAQWMIHRNLKFIVVDNICDQKGKQSITRQLGQSKNSSSDCVFVLQSIHNFILPSLSRAAVSDCCA